MPTHIKLTLFYIAIITILTSTADANNLDPMPTAPRKRPVKLYRVITPTKTYEACYKVAESKGTGPRIIETEYTRVTTTTRPIIVLRCDNAE